MLSTTTTTAVTHQLVLLLLLFVLLLTFIILPHHTSCYALDKRILWQRHNNGGGGNSGGGGSVGGGSGGGGDHSSSHDTCEEEEEDGDSRQLQSWLRRGGGGIGGGGSSTSSAVEAGYRLKSREEDAMDNAANNTSIYERRRRAKASDDPPPLRKGLIRTNDQPMFKEPLPRALDPSFIYQVDGGNYRRNDVFRKNGGKNNKISIRICKNTKHETGLVNRKGKRLKTPIYGYSDAPSGSDETTCTWPGKTFETEAGFELYVTWKNDLPPGGNGEDYLLTSIDGDSVLDTNTHWAYSLPGYQQYTIRNDGVPIVPHLHGAHSDSAFDGNPEFFFSPNWKIKGPQWKARTFRYNDDIHEKAATKWYHDHALGITRLNVYAGLAGFFMLRDKLDTGRTNNPLNLPAYPYEESLAIQDRMFKTNGELFYPAFPRDPFYADFIDDEGAKLPKDLFPNGGPTALAEFFGDVIVVNGKIWPKLNVEPRNYRFHVLNGCDSRFLLVQFYAIELGETEVGEKTGGREQAIDDDNRDTFIAFGSDLTKIPFWVIGADQGLAHEPRRMKSLLVEPGARYDIIFDFSGYKNSRIVMCNAGPDEPFSGDPDDFGFPKKGPDFLRTDRVMAFDVTEKFNKKVADRFDPSLISVPPVLHDYPVYRTRKVALFEGLDEFGRLQPMLGTAEPARDYRGWPIYWPYTRAHQRAGLAGKQMEGTMAWHEPTTENPRLGTTEIWEIWNVSADAHPVHMHLVHFEIMDRHKIKWDSGTCPEDRVRERKDVKGDGTYLEAQPVVQHDGSIAEGYRIVNPTMRNKSVEPLFEIFEDAPLDVVTALPGQVTRIKTKFDKPGRFVWHCHILAHEDHDMMRVMYVS